VVRGDGKPELDGSGDEDPTFIVDLPIKNSGIIVDL
jgi:hypothetical protein